MNILIISCHNITCESTEGIVLKFYNAMAVPSVLYGSKCWTLTEKQKEVLTSQNSDWILAS